MRSYRFVVCTTVLIIAAILSGCAQHAQTIRGAQDSFSRGAELELARKFGLAVPGIDNPTEEAGKHYAMAFGQASEALNDDATDLKRDSLYGTALTIKALAAWRLGDWSTAKRAADEVIRIPQTNGGTNRVWPRDYGICVSLVALAQIDDLAERAAAFEKMKDAEKTGEALKTIVADGLAAQEQLEDAAARAVAEDHPFQFYLAQAHCELAYVLLVATSAGTTLPQKVKADAKTAYMAVRSKALERLARLHEDAQTGLSGDLTAKVKEYYRAQLHALN